jgi:hypothetical protein
MAVVSHGNYCRDGQSWPGVCDEVDSISQFVCITDDGSSTGSYNNEASDFTLPRPASGGSVARSSARPETAARSRPLSSKQRPLTARPTRPISEDFFLFDDDSRTEYVSGICAVESSHVCTSSTSAYAHDANNLTDHNTCLDRKSICEQIVDSNLATEKSPANRNLKLLPPSKRPCAGEETDLINECKFDAKNCFQKTPAVDPRPFQFPSRFFYMVFTYNDLPLTA